MDKNIEKAREMIKKEIDPIYLEVAERVQAGLKDSKYFPWIMERLMNLDQARLARLVGVNSIAELRSGEARELIDQEQVIARVQSRVVDGQVSP